MILAEPCCCLPRRTAGLLLPPYHQAYWLGLTAGADSYRWLDSLANASYQNWRAGGSGPPLPSPGLCAAASTEQEAPAGAGYPWDVVQCSGTAIFVCKIRRECSAAALRRAVLTYSTEVSLRIVVLCSTA